MKRARAQKGTPTEGVALDLAEARGVVAGLAPKLNEAEHRMLRATLDVLEMLVAEVRRRGATIARLRAMIGQRSSEKTAEVVGAGTRAESAASGGERSSAPSISAANDAQPAARTRSRPKRKGHGRIAASSYACEPTPIAHPSLRPGERCPDCAHGALYDTREPAPVVIIVGQPPLAAERFEAQCLRCGGCGSVFTAPLPERARGPKYTVSAAAMLAVSHYSTGIPFHRLEQVQRSFGVPVPAATQWEVVRDHVPEILPVYDVLASLAADAPLLHNDDTYVKILALMGKRRRALEAAGELELPERKGLFTTAIVAKCAVGPVVLFASGRAHAGENLADLLARRDAQLPAPTQMCDGLDRNLPDEHDVVLANCLAHARRHIVDEVGNHPEICRHILVELGKVFRNEDACRRGGMAGDERLALHQRESGPVMRELKAWIDELVEHKRVEPNSGLGGALAYMTKRWEQLTLFLRVPDAPLDNNVTERSLKVPIRARRASLFYATKNGAFVGDVYMALIYTALLHGCDPFRYLTALFTHHKDVAAAPELWLPWNYEETLARRPPNTTLAA